MAKPLPNAELLKSLLGYKEEDGTLFWRPRPREMFSTDINYLRWNSEYPGTVAGRVTRAGYRSIKVMGEAFQAHRIVWKMVTGEEPGEIDHINRDKLDNRFANLRNVSRSVNMRNKGLDANNTSGHKHIHWMPRLQRWTVQLTVPGKGQRQLAYCETIEEAVEVRNRLYEEFGYYK